MGSIIFRFEGLVYSGVGGWMGEGALLDPLLLKAAKFKVPLCVLKHSKT